MKQKKQSAVARKAKGKSAAPARKAAVARKPTAEVWVNQLLIRAARARASDIHIKPTGSGVTVLFRTDGELHRVEGPPADLDPAIIERIKVMSRMNPAEERIAQDGRFGAIIDSREIDFRVSSFPMTYGETIVLKMLDRARLRNLDKLGFSPPDLKRVRDLIARPRGLVLVTGPNGSGKTTTLYAMLSALASGKRNIVTIENPVEFDLEGVGQSQVNPAAGFTYPAALAKVLRQDPDVVMVGGLADKEVATATMRAALTGRLVFSSTHAGDASEALVQLLALGVEPAQVVTGLEGIIAQRLVRLICPSCKYSYRPDPKIAEVLGLKPPQKVYQGRGCARCGNTGYQGRLGVFEVMPMTDELRKLVATNPDAKAVRTFAYKTGVSSMLSDARAKALAGLTTLDEVTNKAWYS